MNLTLSPTIIGGDKIANDYVVKFEGRPVGRIRETGERIGHNPGWDWVINPPIPIPTWCHGSTDDLEQAKAALKEAWENFYATLRPEDIKRWHETADAAYRINRARP